MKKIKGLAIHVHHDILVEYCYDYNLRVNEIKFCKPENEIPIRLKLFKMLSKEAITELPKSLIKAIDAKKTYVEWDRVINNYTYADHYKIYKAKGDYYKAIDNYYKAIDDYNKVIAKTGWNKAKIESWHTKYCGCKEWNGKEIIFKKIM